MNKSRKTINAITLTIFFICSIISIVSGWFSKETLLGVKLNIVCIIAIYISAIAIITRAILLGKKKQFNKKMALVEKNGDVIEVSKKLIDKEESL